MLFKSSRPIPLLVSVVAPATGVPRTMVLLGLSTLTTPTPALKVMTPFQVVLNALGPKFKVLTPAPKATGLAMVRAARAPTSRVLLSPISSVPSPSGLDVIVLPTVLGVESAVKMSEPALRFTPVEPIAPKVLCPPSTRPLVPILVITLVAPAPVIAPDRIRPSGDAPLTLNVRVALPRAMVPAIVGVNAGLSLVALMSVPSVSVPPEMIAGPLLTAVIVVLVADAVAAEEIRKLVPFRMLVISAPPGMLEPLTVCPTASPTVEATVTVVEPLTVVELTSAAGVLTAEPLMPPLLLNVTVPWRVLLPKYESTPAPLMVMLVVAGIWPLLVSMFTVALLIVKPQAAGMTVTPAPPLRFTTPLFTTVPPA